MAPEPQPFRLILASGSPARRELLTRVGYRFEFTRPRSRSRPRPVTADPRSYVQTIAWIKAAAVATTVDRRHRAGRRHRRLVRRPAGICKPDDEADARRILRLLGGRHHELWTGVCLWRKPDGVQLAWQEMSRVHMKAMTDAELDDYITPANGSAAPGPMRSARTATRC